MHNYATNDAEASHHDDPGPNATDTEPGTGFGYGIGRGVGGEPYDDHPGAEGFW